MYLRKDTYPGLRTRSLFLFSSAFSDANTLTTRRSPVIVKLTPAFTGRMRAVGPLLIYEAFFGNGTLSTLQGGLSQVN